jgi:hypothetical protein
MTDRDSYLAGFIEGWKAREVGAQPLINDETLEMMADGFWSERQKKEKSR